MIVLLILCVAACIAVPYLPAVLEVLRQRDAEPLDIGEVYVEDVRHAPDRFLTDVASMMTDDGPERGDVRLCPVKDGLPREMLEQTKVPVVLVGSNHFELTDGLSALAPLYSQQGFSTGKKGRFEGLYSGGDLQIGAGTHASTWVAAEGDVEVADGCLLSGSLRSRRLVMGSRCRFERLSASVIDFGHEVRPEQAASCLREEPCVPVRRRYVHGDLTLPPRSVIDGSLVVSGSLTIGRLSMVVGSVRAGGDIRLGAQCALEGNVFSDASVFLDRDTYVHGVVSAIEDATIHAGCTVGTPGHPTTVSARRVYVFTTARVMGTVWAHEHGEVMSTQVPDEGPTDRTSAASRDAMAADRSPTAPDKSAHTGERRRKISL